MSKLLVAIAALFITSATLAQTEDSLFVIQQNNAWVIPHKIRKGETLFLLSRRYHVPPAILANFNRIPYTQNFAYIDSVTIPVSAYNTVKDKPKPSQMTDVRALYYRVGPGEDNLRPIARISDAPQHVLQEWNNLPDNRISAGQSIVVGWLLYDATQFPGVEPPVVQKSKIQVTTEPPPPALAHQGQQPVEAKAVSQAEPAVQPADTAKKVESPLQEQYMTQTSNEANVISEKGPAVFFDKTGKGGVYYAFHNLTPHGTIIKVLNPGNGKIVYVKVIGPLPETRQYAGSVIGISSAAKEELGATDEKMWCELTYVPN